MPHQLRRIIGINLRNPNVDNPSLTIAELDPRGAVIAAGDNGVGKTSFLRLLPLFYGARPSEILRGTGLDSMIRYMLPHPSSAVVFEYERETSEDLRCAVMHARADEDAPEFHIIRGGYEERFFFDEQDTFVTRDEFKARVESFGVQVDQKLKLNQYRSVILNEKLHTKEGFDMRRLAALHSLGPTSLHGLDQIAAAMANEKISFRDLQNIVIERISASLGDDSQRQTVREIKKSAKDVTGWLANHDHLARLKLRRPDADKLLKNCDAIRQTDVRLRELRHAVQTLVAELQEKSRGFAREQQQVQERAKQQGRVLSDALAKAQAEVVQAKAAHDKAKQTVTATENQAQVFAELKIEDLVNEQDCEGQLKAEYSTVDAELTRINDAVQGITTSFADRAAAVERVLVEESTRLGAERLAAETANKVQLEATREGEAEAQRNVLSPPRLGQIAVERGEAHEKRGALNGELQRPQASEALLEAMRKHEVKLTSGRGHLSASEQAYRQAADKDRVARGLRDDAQRALAQYREGTRAAAAELAAIDSRMKPVAGSLLEYLRAQPPGLVGDLAKVIEPKLLQRTDLAPQPASANNSEAGSITAGPVVLDVRAVPAPDWLDMSELHQRRTKAVQLLDKLRQDEKLAQDRAEQANSAADAASSALTLADGKLAQMNDDLQQMQDHLDQQLRAQERQQVAARVTAINAELAKLAKKLQALGQEEERLLAEHAGAVERLSQDFNDQRQSANSELARTIVRIEEEARRASTAASSAIEKLEAERSGALAEAGVDAKAEAALRTRHKNLADRLRKIVSNRHYVAEWLEFKGGELAKLALNKELLRVASASLDSSKTKCSSAAIALEQLSSATQARLVDLATNISSLDTDARRLGELIEQELTNFEALPSQQMRTWTPSDLDAEVRGRRQALRALTESVREATTSLRALMRDVPGTVSDWVSEAEKDLTSDERLADHQKVRERGMLLSQWFHKDYVHSVSQLHGELEGYFSLAGDFVRYLDLFDRQVGNFNRDLQEALSKVSRFESFRDLKITIRSNVKDLGYLKNLRAMQDVSNSQVALVRAVSGASYVSFDLPPEEVVALMRSFRDMLQRDGGIRVNLSEQVRLDCSLTMNNRPIVITNEDEFRARASNGNSALIVAMFLVGFTQMIRKDSPVRITWVTDEIGRFDQGNLAAFLNTLNSSNIDVISATPNADPASLSLFDRWCLFESNGEIRTYRGLHEEVSHVQN